MRQWGIATAMAAVAVLLASCAQPIKTMWLRTDGQIMRENPVLSQQFEIDRTICAGETSKANMSGAQFCRGAADCIAQSADRQQGAQIVAKGCMAERGYLNVPEEQAAEKSAELRALAALKNQPPPTAAGRSVARR